MMKYLIVLFLLPTVSFGQLKHDYNIVSGFWNDGEPNYDRVGTLLSFSDDGLTQDSFGINTIIDTYNGCISDKNGSLLMYTNGCDIRNAQGQLIHNGDNLNINSNTWAEDCDREHGYKDGAQRSIFLPYGEDDSLYYLIHQASDFINWQTDSFGIAARHLMCTKIIRSDTGLVAVEKNVEILGGERMDSGNVTAIPHANRRNWWVYTRAYEEEKSYRILIDDSGVHTMGAVEFGPPIGFNDGGSSLFSPDGSKFIFYEWWHGLHIYDYDRSTGVMTDEKVIQVPVGWDTTSQNILAGRTGTAMSPNGRFVYISTALALQQVDLLDGSTVNVGIWDGLQNPNSSAFNQMILGPDCRLYMCTIGQSKSIHVINNPDEKGAACNFGQHQIELIYPAGARTFPYFPHYRVDEQNICDR